MQKNVKRVKAQKQPKPNSCDQMSILDIRQSANESQETLGISLLESYKLTSREPRFLAFIAVIICLTIFMILTVAALVTQNLFLLSTIPMMVREATYLFRRAVDSLLPKTSFH